MLTCQKNIDNFFGRHLLQRVYSQMSRFINSVIASL